MKPKFKRVSKEDFYKFIDEYPKPLERDVCGIYEPPLISYNDFSDGKVWPDSIVAKTFFYEDNEDGYYYEKPEDRKYFVLQQEES